MVEERRGVDHLHGKLIRDLEFEIVQCAFSYCTPAERASGRCFPLAQFKPGKDPLNLIVGLQVDPSLIGQSVSIALAFDFFPGERLIWSDYIGSAELKFADGSFLVSYSDDASLGYPPYPAPLKELEPGQYRFSAGVATADGSHSDFSFTFFNIR